LHLKQKITHEWDKLIVFHNTIAIRVAYPQHLIDDLTGRGQAQKSRW